VLFADSKCPVIDKMTNSLTMTNRQNEQPGQQNPRISLGAIISVRGLFEAKAIWPSPELLLHTYSWLHRLRTSSPWYRSGGHQ
jgi:hypothetical protein